MGLGKTIIEKKVNFKIKNKGILNKFVRMKYYIHVIKIIDFKDNPQQNTTTN